jgi:hypothetical protein
LLFFYNPKGQILSLIAQDFFYLEAQLSVHYSSNFPLYVGLLTLFTATQICSIYAMHTRFPHTFSRSVSDASCNRGYFFSHAALRSK